MSFEVNGVRVRRKSDWRICIKRSFMVCTGHEIYLADEIKSYEGRGGAWHVEGMGKGRDCTFIVVETSGKEITGKK